MSKKSIGISGLAAYVPPYRVWLEDWLLPDWMVVVPLFATSLYIPVYLYKAMRRVYGQRHLATAPKFIGMIIAYFTGLLLILGITGVLAAFSI